MIFKIEVKNVTELKTLNSTMRAAQALKSLQSTHSNSLAPLNVFI